MTLRSTHLGVIFDADANLAVLCVDETPLCYTIRANAALKKDAKEVAEFCCRCARHGGAVFPSAIRELTLDEAEQSLEAFVRSCTALLEQAMRYGSEFPLPIGPSEGYLIAATRGKLIEFDRAAKAIVDEYSCGGFIAGWKADDAYAFFMRALEDNEWNVSAALTDARTELGLVKSRRQIPTE